MSNENNPFVSTNSPPRGHWTIDDVPYGKIEPRRVADDPYLFYMLAAASMVEFNSDLYTRNLLEYFHGDAALRTWLERQWQREEVQHGAALRRYVKTVWPDFDWDCAYHRFGAEYACRCRPELLGPTQTLELAARCVVETGTASLYTMLSRLSPEPVLSKLFMLIRNDEVRHYRYFYLFFREYQNRQPQSHYALARTLWRRVREIKNEDAYYALKHVYLERHPGGRFDSHTYRLIRRHYTALAHRYYPYDMAVRMFVKPLRLHRRLQRAALPLLAAGARHFGL